MGLLRRIEGAGAPPPAAPAPPYAVPATPAPSPTPPPPGGNGAQGQPPAAPLRTGLTVANPTARTVSLGRDLKMRVKNRLIAELDPEMDLSKTAEVRQRIKMLFDLVVESENIVLTRVERERLFEEVTADIIGFGPIEPLLQDPTINEVMVNGPNQVYVEQRGRLYRTDVVFDDDEHVRRIIDRIVSPLGRHVDEASPLCDARLPDGSRVNIAIPPISLIGPTITIRKFSKNPLGIDDLIRFGTMTPEIAEFLRACVVARLNIVISGGTGSGKTTLLNVLSSFIPNDERIITIEDAAELQLRQEHVVRLEARPPNIEGKGAITIRDLVINALRMRPDRIVVGECRGREALDMLQAMNTGHDGSLTTAHANSPRDVLSRLETMVLMAGMDLPVRAIREQISSAVDLIVHQARLRDGSRKITHITEVQGMEGDTITLQDVFLFEQEAYESGKVIGRIRPTGVRPKFMPKLEDAGIHLPATVFGLPDRFF
ncbi:MAG TPA: CpaF family protein [Chloroflexota bacterium]|jgi:pilus assembly protein CpaF|nr:CpaF family protein [Chloroflexota bacterium]